MLSLDEKELHDISDYIKERYGVNLASKSTLIEGRLGSYVKSKGFETYGEYFDYAKHEASGAEMANLINRLTTNHTFFMRENEHFSIIKNEVLPWIESLPGGHDMRIWSAGCSTGEEPYTLSIYIKEYLAERSPTGTVPDTVILASDISEKALATASEGVYARESLTEMPPEWLEKYFIKNEDNTYKVTPELRRNVAFKKINLLDSIVTKKPYHIILCRNVMIYFDAVTRRSLIDRFCDVIMPGGYLFIGHSESLTNFSHGFKYVQPSVYRKP